MHLHFHTQVSLADICPVGSSKNELWIATNVLFRKVKNIFIMVIKIFDMITVFLNFYLLQKKNMTISVKICEDQRHHHRNSAAVHGS